MIDRERLANEAAAGDRVALDRFVRAIQADVWRFCAHLTRPGDADDLAQESLVRIVTSLPRREGDAVMPWVFAVTRNVCFDHLRKRTRRRTDPVADVPSSEAPDARGVVEILELLAALPLDQREAIVLTQIIGLPYADTAMVVGCPIGTIRSRVARGREAFAEALRAERTGISNI
ncbi:MAG: sigma-70 family RNA polymerase sigma factor [Acidimicrobiia bacterium]